MRRPADQRGRCQYCSGRYHAENDTNHEEAALATGAKFSVGSIVKLKSGGPEMTVQSVPNQYHEYFCQWFAGKKLERGEFPEGSLMKADATPATKAQ